MTLKSLTTALLVAAIGASASGCIINEGNGLGDPDPDPVNELQPFFTAIDPDFVLDTDLGFGAGLFVEYTTGGVWEVWTSCDTKTTGADCDYQVNIKSSSAISGIENVELEISDVVDIVDDNNVSLSANTATRSDGIRFSTAAGADVEVEVILDGIVAPEYMVWYSDGLVHDGADGSPVVFQPSAP